MSEISGESFESSIMECFAFLETEYDMTFGRVREVNRDEPRDYGLIARYQSHDLRIDIGWSEAESSITVSIHLDRDDLSHRESSIYFEPFVEFMTEGAILAIVPQIYRGMSVSKIEAVMTGRAKLLENGFSDPLKKIADKLHEHLDSICSVSSDVLRRYHKWMASSHR